MREKTITKKGKLVEKFFLETSLNLFMERIIIVLLLVAVLGLSAYVLHLNGQYTWLKGQYDILLQRYKDVNAKYEDMAKRAENAENQANQCQQQLQYAQGVLQQANYELIHYQWILNQIQAHCKSIGGVSICAFPSELLPSYPP